MRIIQKSSIFLGIVLLINGCQCGTNSNPCQPPTQAKTARTETPAKAQAATVQKPQPNKSETSTTQETSPKPPAQAKASIPRTAAELFDDKEEISLFDGKTLGLWKPTDFGGQGEVKVQNGEIIMEMGNDMTGITWTGPIIKQNYEITLEAMRVKGSDFFCGLTFPINDSFCSLICGGWGGSLTGLSSINYYDAANNETTAIYDYENGKWYKIRLRVANGKIQAWIDGKLIVDITTKGKLFDTRIEVDESKPLGIATWQTTGAVRNIRWRKLGNIQK